MRQANQSDIETLQHWLIGRQLPISPSVYLVGSLLEKTSAHDLDLALYFNPKRTGLAELGDLMSVVGIFGRDSLSIRIDCSAYPQTHAEILAMSDEGLPFTAYKLASDKLARIAASQDPNVRKVGQLISITRRLDQTNYYAKLPRKRVNGRRLTRDLDLVPFNTHVPTGLRCG